MFRENRKCFWQRTMKIIARAIYGLAAIVLVAVSITPAGSEEYDEARAIAAFYSKVIRNPIVIDGDPYKDFEESTWFEFPEEAVCAIKYEDDRIHYVIATFSDESAAESNGYTVTHKGHCGTCSTLQDLATYLYHRDMTTPVRRCSAMVWFMPWSIHCLEDLGLSSPCAETWYYNAKNTARECLWPCLDSWIRNEPFNKPDGSLNDCLACDEEQSGTVFHYVAGRTRRNSGIRSEIDRPEDEIYPIVHDYY